MKLEGKEITQQEMKMSAQALTCDARGAHLQGFWTCRTAACQTVWVTQLSRRPRTGQCCWDSAVYNADHLPFGEGISCNRYFKIQQPQKSVEE